MSQSWTYDGVSLNTLAYNVGLTESPVSVPPRRGENIIVPHRNGRVHVAKYLDERVVSLGMHVKNWHPTSGQPGSEAQMRANLDTLRGLFARDGQHLLAHTFGTVTRQQMAEVANAVAFQPLSDNLYRLVVEFLLADPLWEATTPTTIGPEAITGGSPQAIAGNNPGTYKADDPVITIEGSVVEPKVQIGSIWVQWNSTVGVGETLTIDCGAFTADVDGTDRTRYILHEGAVNWLEIPTGDFTAQLTHGGSGGTPTITIGFTAKYI